MRMQHEATTELQADRHTNSIRRDRDLDLVEALRLHEPTAAERLVETYGDRAYRLAVRITRAREDAEEVVQDALLTVVRKIESFRGDSAFGSWVYRIVANSAYQKIRGRRRRRGEVSTDAPLGEFAERGREGGPPRDWAVATDDPARQAEIRAALTDALDELPGDFRTLFVLRDLEGRSYTEIGQSLSLSVTNVKTRMHRTRMLLRKRLGGSVEACQTREPRPRFPLSPPLPAAWTA
jgi:RNA polymerase sigma-70 factor, ECF subfamily